MSGILVLLTLLAQPATLEEEPWEALRARIETSPQDVATFIERRTGCNHFWSEAGSRYAERERQIQGMLKELRCNDLPADERALRKMHRDKPDVARLLDETKDLMPW